MSSPTKEVLNTREAAALLGISDKHLRTCVQKYGVPAWNAGSPGFRFHREALLEWLRQKGEIEAAQRLASLTTTEPEHSEFAGQSEDGSAS